MFKRYIICSDGYAHPSLRFFTKTKACNARNNLRKVTPSINWSIRRL